MIPEVEADPGGQSEQERLTLLYVWLLVHSEDGENNIWLDSRQWPEVTNNRISRADITGQSHCWDILPPEWNGSLTLSTCLVTRAFCCVLS